MDSNQPRSSVTLPGAIIIAAALIAIAIIWVKKPVSTPVATNQVAQVGQLTGVNMAPVTAADHIYGNPNASVKIVEYSDPSCPYCKTFNPIMEQVMTQYGPEGKVAWIYRSFPLDKPGTRGDGEILHPNAGHESQALECAAFLGGNDKFWAFEKHLYEATPSVTSDTPNGLDQSTLPQLAKDVGLDPVAFNSCLSSGQFKDKVEKEYTDGLNAGVSGTPYNVIITPSGSKIPLAGAISLSTMKKTIDTLLSADTTTN